MANLRIVSENLADTATITTTPGAEIGLGVDFLKTDIKAEVCRVIDDAVQITAVLESVRGVACVALPACNLSSESTIRVRVYDEVSDGNLVVDTGVKYAAPGINIAYWNPSQDLNANVFGSHPATVAVWFELVAAGRVVIDIADPLRTYIDISRLVIGRYWEPKYNPGYGASLAFEDSTTTTRAASGDLRTERGTLHRVLTLPMEWVDAADRHRVSMLLRRGLGHRHFVSVMPGHSDVGLEQDWMLYGTLRQLSSVAYFAPGLHQTNFQFQEW